MNNEKLQDEKWLQLRTTSLPERAEECAQILLDWGCAGAQIDDTEILFDQSEDATFRPRERAVITAFLPIGQTSEYSRETVMSMEAALRDASLDAPLEIDDVAAQDWANNWRQNFPPLDIPPFRICATWHNEARDSAASNAESIELLLDPGLAFGTGQHPTTRLCLQLLAGELREYSQNENAGSQAPHVLDVGCGSGVLSIAAAKLGARVWASDLDPFCTRATLENAELNDVKLEETREIAGADWALEEQPHGFDLVVANLMSALLILLAPQLFAVVREGGKLVVSGISAPRADEVESALKSAGFTTLQKREEDGETRGDFIERWAAFVFEK